MCWTFYGKSNNKTQKAKELWIAKLAYEILELGIDNNMFP
jgi:hypothetical protein